MVTKLDKDKVVEALWDVAFQARIDYYAGRIDRAQYTIRWEGFQMAANLIDLMEGEEA